MVAAVGGRVAENSKLTDWLTRAHPAVFSAFAILAAFSTYFSMYAFRKPFAAGSYLGEPKVLIDLSGFHLAPEGLDPDEVVFGALVTYKTLAVMSQVFGYATSKFLGIKVISEMTPSKRAWMIAACMSVAWGSLALFALIPAPYNLAALFMNGIPLGMIWGLVFGYLEGRQVSEVLGAGLSLSYIVASGAVKGLGSKLLDVGVPEFWMPFVTGAFFVLPMAFFVYLLSSLPPPTEEDERLRTKREPMNGKARTDFFMAYAPGLIPLTLLYVLLTAYRDIRDNFAVEIWKGVGYDDPSFIMMVSEWPVAFGVMLGLALLYTVQDNRKALIAVHALMAFGTALIGIATLLYQAELITPAAWMVLLGLGLYLAYVPYGCVLFDRLIAALGVAGTAGFLIYLTDSAGYFGAVSLMLYRDLVAPDQSWVEFFATLSYATSGVCTTLFLVAMFYFGRKTS
jgi:hypothetical protein